MFVLNNVKMTELKMRPYKLTVTDSFRKLPIQADDIAFDVNGGIVFDGVNYYEFVIKLGGGFEAILLVDENTVENRPEYFKFVKNQEEGWQVKPM